MNPATRTSNAPRTASRRAKRLTRLVMACIFLAAIPLGSALGTEETEEASKDADLALGSKVSSSQALPTSLTRARAASSVGIGHSNAVRGLFAAGALDVEPFLDMGDDEIVQMGVLPSSLYQRAFSPLGEGESMNVNVPAIDRPVGPVEPPEEDPVPEAPMPNVCNILTPPGTCGRPAPESCDYVGGVPGLCGNPVLGYDTISDAINDLAMPQAQQNLADEARSLYASLLLMQQSWETSPLPDVPSQAPSNATASVPVRVAESIDAAVQMADHLAGSSLQDLAHQKDLKRFGSDLRVIHASLEFLQAQSNELPTPIPGLEQAWLAFSSFAEAVSEIEQSLPGSRDLEMTASAHQIRNDDGTPSGLLDVDASDDSAIKWLAVPADWQASLQQATLYVLAEGSECQTHTTDHVLRVNDQHLLSFDPCISYPSAAAWRSFDIPVSRFLGEARTKFEFSDWGSSWEYSNAHYFYSTPDRGASRMTQNGNDVPGELLIYLEVVLSGGSNQPPAACFSVDPPQGSVGQVFQFDAACTTDESPPNDIQVAWDWESDGTLDTAWKTQKTESKALPAGENWVTLHARDPQGAEGTRSTPVYVGDGAPQACFDVDPSSGSTSTLFLFSADCTSDDDTAFGLLNFQWDFDNDGYADTGWQTTYQSESTLPRTGNNVVRLWVRDAFNHIGTTTRVVTIGANLPVPCFTASPGSFRSPVNVDAECSTDDTTPTYWLQVRWDWENDGIFDALTTNKKASHQFTRPGEYTVVLEVVDADGASARTSKKILVSSLETRSTYSAWMIEQATRNGQDYEALTRYIIVEYEQYSGANWQETHTESYTYIDPDALHSINWKGFQNDQGDYREEWVETQFYRNNKYTAANHEEGWQHCVPDILTTATGIHCVKPVVDKVYTWFMLNWGGDRPAGHRMLLVSRLPSNTADKGYAQNPDGGFCPPDSDSYALNAKFTTYLKTYQKDANIPQLGEHDHERFVWENRVMDVDCIASTLAATAAFGQQLVELFVKVVIPKIEGTFEFSKVFKFSMIGFAISWFFSFAQTGDVFLIDWYEMDLQMVRGFALPVTMLNTVPNFSPIPYVDALPSGTEHQIGRWWPASSGDSAWNILCQGIYASESDGVIYPSEAPCTFS